MKGYFGIYWTFPVPWVGLTRFDDVDHAARISRTIRYQRDRIRREIATLRSTLQAEAAFIETAPDRGSPEIAAEIARTTATRPDLTPVLVDFAAVLGWRRHGDLMMRMRDAGALFLTPDPTFIDGVAFDPARHFRDWAERWKDHADSKPEHRRAVLQAVAAAPDPATIAQHLNGLGLRTHTGKTWTPDNLRKFLRKA